ncbi:TPA: hypothetical protein ACG0AV_002070 [Elizabethkingia anophelis]
MEISNYAFWILVVYFALGIIFYQFMSKHIPDDKKPPFFGGYVTIFWLPLIITFWNNKEK